jgi:hypothetical protein
MTINKILTKINYERRNVVLYHDVRKLKIFLNNFLAISILCEKWCDFGNLTLYTTNRSLINTKGTVRRSIRPLSLMQRSPFPLRYV